MPSGDMLQTVEKILKKLEKGQTIRQRRGS